MTIAQVMANLGWLFAEKDIKDFFIFGVVRDPYEFTLSLYNSHRSSHFEKTPRLYTGDMTFSEFLLRWIPLNSSQVLPQYRRFLDSKGRIGANYIMTYDRVTEGLNFVTDSLRRERLPELRELNKSTGKLSRSALQPSELEWIASHFEEDFTFISRYCNKYLDSFQITPLLSSNPL